MTLDTSEFQTKNATRDSDLGAAVVAATTIIGVTAGGSNVVAVAGVIAAAFVVSVAVAGRYIVRRGGVDAAGLVRATEIGAAAPTDEAAVEAYADKLEQIETERDAELLALNAAGQAEQTGREAPPSIDAIPEWDGDDLGDTL